MKKQLALLFLVLFCEAQAQDPHFNNIAQSLVYLNPSYAGSEKCLRNQTNYRNQWPNLSGTYVTYQSCFDGYIKAIKGGLALRVTSDDANRGTLRRTGMALSYAQYIKLSNNITMIPSIQGSYNQSTLDKGRLNFGDMIDSRYGILWTGGSFTTPWFPADVPVSSLKYADVAAGLMVKYHEDLQIGVSFSNLFEPNISHLGTYHLPVRTNVHLLYKAIVNPRTDADVSILGTFQNGYYNLRMNIIIKGWCGLTYGLGYGTNNSFYVLSGADNPIQQNVKGFLGYSTQIFRILYSYDANVNKMAGNTAGSHELSLEIKFKKKEATKNGSSGDAK
jgi:type IX secretion system PorP/SprF family membrane protein